ncbi:MAG TPA: hypothetical protein VMS88_02885 [Terriglobales bacterium]|nr:hypothetical protein [Terriglobales bacterium]
MDAFVPVPPASASPADPRTRRTYLVFCVLALVSWGQVAFRQAGDLGLSGAPGLAAAAGLALASRVAAAAIEAWVYALAWRALGARLPVLWFGIALVALSVVDRLALSLAELAHRAPASAPWAAVLAGPHLLGSRWLAGEPGLRAALGGIGVLTALRLGMTAWLQAAALRRRMRGPLLLTLGIWWASRVALWWTTDLIRGASPLP